MIKKIRIWFVFLSFVGLTDIALIYSKTAGYNLKCVVFSGCDSVLHSVYSELFGVHLYVFGFIFYLFILLLSVYGIYSKKKIIKNILSIWITLGFAFSLYLFYVQAFLLKEFCSYCITSLIVTTTMFILVLLSIKQNYIKSDKNI